MIPLGERDRLSWRKYNDIFIGRSGDLREFDKNSLEGRGGVQEDNIDFWGVRVGFKTG